MCCSTSTIREASLIDERTQVEDRECDKIIFVLYLSKTSIAEHESMPGGGSSDSESIPGRGSRIEVVGRVRISGMACLEAARYREEFERPGMSAASELTCIHLLQVQTFLFARVLVIDPGLFLTAMSRP